MRAMTQTEKTVYLETFGCQMNVADSEVVLARLADDGYNLVKQADDADLVLYNTCSVRDNAEAKIRGRLGSLQKLKRERQAAGQNLTVGIMGCMAQREKEDLVKKHPIVALVVGTDQFVHLPELLARQQEEGKIVATEFGDFETVNWSARRNEGITAYVPVMRGCNYNCTYCIVPKTRGDTPAALCVGHGPADQYYPNWPPNIQ